MQKKLKDYTGLEKIRDCLFDSRTYFFETLFPHYIKTIPAIGVLHKEWFNLLATEKKLLIVAPRSHSKSTIINIVDNLFDICNGNKKYIMIFSDTPAQAKEHLGNIVEELENNELLIKIYGRLYKGRKTQRGLKDKWTESEIITTTGIKVVAKSWRLKTRGARFKEQRPDKIVLDDITGDETANSEVLRKKLKNVFEKKILNLGSFDTTYRVVGTILHFDDLLKHELDNPREGWTVKSYKAIKKDGTALWSEWWNLEKLDEKKKEIGSIAFEQEFMNNPIDISKAIIRREWIQRYNGQFQVKANKCLIKGEPLFVVTAVDPNASEKQQSDDFAIVSVGLHPSGRVSVLSRIAGKFSLLKHAQLILDEYKRVHSDEIWIESVFYQQVLYAEFNRLCAQEQLYPSIFTTKPDSDKIRRVKSTQPMYENGHIWIPDYMQDLYDQIVEFPLAAHDDMLDALTMCLQRIKFGAGGVGHGNEDKLRADSEIEVITKGLQSRQF